MKTKELFDLIEKKYNLPRNKIQSYYQKMLNDGKEDFDKYVFYSIIAGNFYSCIDEKNIDYGKSIEWNVENIKAIKRAEYEAEERKRELIEKYTLKNITNAQMIEFLKTQDPNEEFSINVTVVEEDHCYGMTITFDLDTINNQLEVIGDYS